MRGYQQRVEGWLDAELGRLLGSVRGPSPRAAQAGYRARRRRRSPAPAPAAGWAALVAAAAVLAAAGGGAVTGAIRAPNPIGWGQEVVRAVQQRSVPGDAAPSPLPSRAPAPAPSGAAGPPGPGAPAPVEPARPAASPDAAPPGGVGHAGQGDRAAPAAPAAPAGRGAAHGRTGGGQRPGPARQGRG